MKNFYSISIPDPCHEDWHTMKPEEKGRFCSSCSKTVIDFTKMNTSDIQDFLNENINNSFCGHFKQAQLDSINVYIPSEVVIRSKSFHKIFLLALLITMGTSLMSCTNKNGKKQKIDSIEILDSSNDTIPPLPSVGLPVLNTLDPDSTKTCTKHKNKVVCNTRHKMKYLNIFLFLIISNYLNAQISMDKFPFDLSTLSIQKAYSIENILPRIENHKFYYFNKKTGEKEFNENFEEAYPYIGKSALIKKNGKYGVINLNGNYIIKPTYESYQLPPYEDESNLVIFSEDLIFDLSSGIKSENGYIICAEPAVPDFKPFSNENKKYGIKKFSDEIIVKATYDSIIDIHFDFFVVKLKNKIGVINTSGENLIPFDFDEVTFSRGDYYATPQKIGLKKGNKWTYFKLPSTDRKAILTSKEKCSQMHNLFIENSVGIFEKGKQLNILFENGKNLDNYYDWISENGLVGVKNESVYFLNSDSSSTLYYE